jgi:DNA transformation protein
MSTPIEETPNIGKALGQRLRTVGIDTRDKLETLGDTEAFLLLTREFPEDACTHTRLALAGAVRGVRWWGLSDEIKTEATCGLSH